MNTGTRSYCLLLVAVSALVVLGVSACTPANPGVQTPEPSSTAPTTQADTTPRIENPKNLAAISNACALLTPEQLDRLGAAENGEESTSKYGQTQCEWSNDNFAVNVAINTKYGEPADLRSDIKNKANFTPEQVKGYPAARVNAQSILCEIEVAVAEGQSVEVYYAKYSGDAPAMQKPCQYAEKIAAEVLENIPDA